MELCPHLADEVRSGCRRNDRFVALHDGHRRQLAECIGAAEERIETVGAGFREDLFHPHGRSPEPPGRLVYVGKLSPAKGLGPLLDAFERLLATRPGLELHVAGAGGGPEAEALERRIRAMAPSVVLHGPLAQPELAELLRTAKVCVLPSFFEGLPLVLVEALACGCRLVATDIPSVRSALAKRLGAAMELVPPPRLRSIDVPVSADLPAFVDGLAHAMENALDQPPLPTDTPWLRDALRQFTWDAVFDRIERVWEELLA
jgi:glycosyltransferase involved in cell wall biosynthesis